MTAIPPPQTGLQTTLTQLNTTLENVANGILLKNQRSLNDVYQASLMLVDVGRNLRQSFDKADSLQIKSLSVGSSLNKLLSDNTNVLSKLRGDYFNNANEILENFIYGIENSSEAMMALNNVMFNTGQDTDVLRKAIGSLSMHTGGSTEAIESLSKNTVKLSDQYGTTTEMLLKAVQAIEDTSKTFSLLGQSQQIQEVFQAFSARFKEMGFEDAKKAFTTLIDPRHFETQVRLGVADLVTSVTDGNLSLGRRLDNFNRILSIAGVRLESIADRSKKAQFQGQALLTELGALGDSDALNSIGLIYKLSQSNINKENKFRDDTSKYYETIMNVEAEALNFYKKFTGYVFPLLLDVLPAIKIATIGLGAGTAAGGLAQFFGPLATSMRTLGKFLPVVGTAVGILSMIPSVNKLITGYDPELELDYAKESAKRLKSIDDKTKPPDNPSTKVGTNLSEMISRELVGYITNRTTSNSSKEIVEALRDVREAIEKGNKTRLNNSRPAF